MARRYLLTCLASAIFIFGIARGGHAQEQRPDAFAALEARLARLESNAGSAIDRRSLARAHGELLSLRATVAGMEGVASRDARRRLAKLSNRLRALSQGDAAAVVRQSAWNSHGSVPAGRLASGRGSLVSNNSGSACFLLRSPSSGVAGHVEVVPTMIVILASA